MGFSCLFVIHAALVVIPMAEPATARPTTRASRRGPVLWENERRCNRGTRRIFPEKYSHADLKDLEFPENDVRDLADVLTRNAFKVTMMSTSAARSDTEHFPDAGNIRRQLAVILKDASKQNLNLWASI